MSEITNDGWRHMLRSRTSNTAAGPAATTSDRLVTLKLIGAATNGALVAVTLLVVGAAGGMLLAKEKLQDIVRVEIISAAQHVARGCTLGTDGIWRDSKKGVRCDQPAPPPPGPAAGPSVPSARTAPPAQG